MTVESREEAFISFFRIATKDLTPYRWQLQVALDGLPEVLAVPTGLGKTEVALACGTTRLTVGSASNPGTSGRGCS